METEKGHQLGIGIFNMEASLSCLTEMNIRGDVHIYDKKNLALIEVTIRNKKSREIHVNEYFKAGNYIRVCSSRDNDFFNGQYYQILYAELCCMIDTGDIFKLNRTTTE